MSFIIRHYGPGPHKSGTPQSVHGGRGGAKSAFMTLTEHHVSLSAKDGKPISKGEAIKKVANDLLSGYSHEEAWDAWHTMGAGRMAGSTVSGTSYSRADWKAAIKLKFGSDQPPKGYQPPEKPPSLRSNWLKMTPSKSNVEVMNVLRRKVTPGQMKYLVKQMAELSLPELRRRQDFVTENRQKYGGDPTNRADYDRYEKLLTETIMYKEFTGPAAKAKQAKKDAAAKKKAATVAAKKPRRVVVKKIAKSKAVAA